MPHPRPQQPKDAVPKGFGDQISDPDRQTTEIRIRVALMNRFSASRTAKIVRVANLFA